MGTFQDDLATAGTNVFGATDGSNFNVAITHRKRGDAEDTETIYAQIDRDNERQFIAGNALTRSDRHGERYNANIYLTMSTSVEIDPNDKFVLEDGTLVNFVEVLERSDLVGRMTVACVSPNGISTKNPRLRP